MTAPDPFADDPIERDGYNRPKIIPVGRGSKPNLKAKLVPYTRVSTFADALSDAGGLVKWSKWHLALGLGRNPDLAALAGAYGPTVDDLTRQDKANLDAIIERAHDRSGGNVKADYGTAVHSYTEPGAQDVPDPFDDTQREQAHAALLASIAADRDAYLAELARHGLEVIDTEQFVVNDEAQAAGTYDHTVRATRDITFDDGVTIPAGTVLVLDKKTGKLHLDSQCIQLAVYANAKRYDPETGERSDLGASFEWGILAHIPKGEARCVLHRIDLRVGWAAAKLAGKVREHRTRKDIGHVFPTVEPTEPASDALDVVTFDVTVTGSPAEGVTDLKIIATDAAAPALAKIAEDAAKYDAALAKAREATKAARVPRDDFDDMAEAVATVTAIFPDAEEVLSRLQRLAIAESRDELAAIWASRATDGDGEWTDDHTATLRARAAELEQAA